MTEAEVQAMLRENAYLKLRNSQLQAAPAPPVATSATDVLALRREVDFLQKRNALLERQIADLSASARGGA
ncbi:hypothetical protein ACO2Q3_06010 [Caulobacter sp. KR2-114]|uniref:hypothetical protein n=1 Tax=Caulobacter sp. KR2-114 TaxID=3400912 RepID=UPI003C0C6586